MASFLLGPRLVLAAMALSIPFAASGACGSRTACFQYTQAEYDAHQQSCPAPASALTGFTSPHCPGSIVSVDGAGIFDGQICCYPVTYDSVDQSCGTQNIGVGGNGPTTGTGFPPGTSSTGPGCSGGCLPAIEIGGVPCGGPPLDAYFTLQACAGCNGVVDDGGPGCAAVCSDFCMNGPASSDCTNCLVQSCVSELSSCQNN